MARTRALARAAVGAWAGLIAAALVACGAPGAAVDVAPGTTVWSETVASVGVEDEVLAVAAGPGGVVAYGGLTYGDVGANPNQGGADGFVALLEADGTERWRVAFGDVGDDAVRGVAVRPDGVVVAVGVTTPSLGDPTVAFASGLDGATGAVLWKRSVDTPEDDVAVAVAIAADGSAFVVGHTGGSVPPAVNQGFRDAFLLRVTAAGAVDGFAMLGGTGFDDAVDVEVLPGGDVVLLGVTGGTVAGAVGTGPLFVARFAPDLLAAPTWVVQAGGALDVVPGAAAVGADGDVVVVGQVSGRLGADPVVGDYDVFLARVAATDGAVTVARQVGTTGYDHALGLALDADGRAWVAGPTATFGAGGDRSEAVLYVFGDDDALLRREVLPVAAHAGANALALVGDREVVVGGWSAPAMPGDRSGWDGFVVRRRHVP